MGIGYVRRIVTLIYCERENMRENICAFSFLLPKNATLSVPEHTHHMNRQVKRSVSVQYRKIITLIKKNYGRTLYYMAEWGPGRLHQPAEFISLAAQLLYLGWSKSQLFLRQHALVKPSPYGWGAEAILLLSGISWGWEAPLQEAGL